MPKIAGLLESALYVDDMELAVDVFERVLELSIVLRGARLTAFDAGGAGVLLLFARGRSTGDMTSPGGIVPGHGGVKGALMSRAATSRPRTGRRGNWSAKPRFNRIAHYCCSPAAEEPYDPCLTDPARRQDIAQKGNFEILRACPGRRQTRSSF